VNLDTKYQGVQKIKSGASMKLQANIAGVPTPAVTWYLADKPVERSSQVKLDSSADQAGLSVGNPTKLNAGKYRVVAENTAGSDSAEITVVILGLLIIFVRFVKYIIDKCARV